MVRLILALLAKLVFVQTTQFAVSLSSSTRRGQSHERQYPIECDLRFTTATTSGTATGICWTGPPSCGLRCWRPNRTPERPYFPLSSRYGATSLW